MSIGPWVMYGRNSQLTWPDFTYLSVSVGTPSSSNALQCGHDSDPISTSFTLALGLPIMKPSEVALTTSAQVPPGGGLAWVIVTFSFVGAAVPPPLPLFLLHPASAMAAAAPIKIIPRFIHSLR